MQMLTVSVVACPVPVRAVPMQPQAGSPCRTRSRRYGPAGEYEIPCECRLHLASFRRCHAWNLLIRNAFPWRGTLRTLSCQGHSQAARSQHSIAWFPAISRDLARALPPCFLRRAWASVNAGRDIEEGGLYRIFFGCGLDPSGTTTTVSPGTAGNVSIEPPRSSARPPSR